MTASRSIRHIGQSTASAVIALLLVLSPCNSSYAMGTGAAFPVMGIEGIAAPVSDSELGEMRGKFISPDAVSFFGISMLTSWEDQSGITTNARLALNVDFLAHDGNGNPVTRFLIGWTRDGDPAMDITDTHEGYVPILVASDVHAIGGLGTTTGAAQANIIAASDNKARNVLEVALVPRSALKGLSGEGLTSANGTTGVSFGDGDSLEFRLSPNQVGLVLTGGNGIDSSMQTVGRDMGQALQQTILNSARNDVLNNMRIVFGTQASATGAADPVRLTEALAAMKGNGF